MIDELANMIAKALVAKRNRVRGEFTSSLASPILYEFLAFSAMSRGAFPDAVGQLPLSATLLGAA